MVRSLVSLFALALTTSGGSGFSSASGKEFPVRSAVYLHSGSGLAVVLTDQPGGCRLAREQLQASHELGLTLRGERALGRGDFALQSESDLQAGHRPPAAQYFVADHAGPNGELETGTTGRVHLDRNEAASGGPVAGNFDVSFRGERLQGRFEATLCGP